MTWQTCERYRRSCNIVSWRWFCVEERARGNGNPVEHKRIDDMRAAVRGYSLVRPVGGIRDSVNRVFAHEQGIKLTRDDRDERQLFAAGYFRTISSCKAAIERRP